MKDRPEEPLGQESTDFFSSLVTSIELIIEGYNYADVLIDCNSGYKWVYGTKNKSDLIIIVKRWYSDIAESMLTLGSSTNQS